jgi:Mrp family chromosome partitioning ATPase
MISPAPYPKTILVSSTLAGEGKSFLVSNLAAGYLARDKRVVILDMDLRRPSQKQLQGAKEEGGLVPWFRAGMPMGNLLGAGSPLGFQRVASGAFLIPAGGEERDANHHITSPQVATLIAELKKQFDVVLIDTPPAGIFQDALQLAARADERILVSRIARAPISHIRKVIATFDDVGAPVTGLVVNGINPTEADRNLSYSYRAGGRAAYYSHRSPDRNGGYEGLRPSVAGKST